jgi:hypothetical protein
MSPSKPLGPVAEWSRVPTDVARRLFGARRQTGGTQPQTPPSTSHSPAPSWRFRDPRHQARRSLVVTFRVSRSILQPLIQNAHSQLQLLHSCHFPSICAFDFIRFGVDSLLFCSFAQSTLAAATSYPSPRPPFSRPPPPTPHNPADCLRYLYSFDLQWRHYRSPLRSFSRYVVVHRIVLRRR